MGGCIEKLQKVFIFFGSFLQETQGATSREQAEQDEVRKQRRIRSNSTSRSSSSSNSRGRQSAELKASLILVIKCHEMNRPASFFVRHIITGMSQGGQVGDFIIAQIGNLGDILDLWAIKFVNKNALKAQISCFGL